MQNLKSILFIYIFILGIRCGNPEEDKNKKNSTKEISKSDSENLKTPEQKRILENIHKASQEDLNNLTLQQLEEAKKPILSQIKNGDYSNEQIQKIEKAKKFKYELANKLINQPIEDFENYLKNGNTSELSSLKYTIEKIRNSSNDKNNIDIRIKLIDQYLNIQSPIQNKASEKRRNRRSKKGKSKIELQENIKKKNISDIDELINKNQKEFELLMQNKSIEELENILSIIEQKFDSMLKTKSTPEMKESLSSKKSYLISFIPSKKLEKKKKESEQYYTNLDKAEREKIEQEYQKKIAYLGVLDKERIKKEEVEKNKKINNEIQSINKSILGKSDDEFRKAINNKTTDELEDLQSEISKKISFFEINEVSSDNKVLISLNSKENIIYNTIKKINEEEFSQEIQSINKEDKIELERLEKEFLKNQQKQLEQERKQRKKEKKRKRAEKQRKKKEYLKKLKEEEQRLKQEEKDKIELEKEEKEKKEKEYLKKLKEKRKRKKKKKVSKKEILNTYLKVFKALLEDKDFFWSIKDRNLFDKLTFFKDHITYLSEEEYFIYENIISKNPSYKNIENEKKINIKSAKEEKKRKMRDAKNKMKENIEKAKIDMKKKIKDAKNKRDNKIIDAKIKRDKKIQIAKNERNKKIQTARKKKKKKTIKSSKYSKIQITEKNKYTEIKTNEKEIFEAFKDQEEKKFDSFEDQEEKKFDSFEDQEEKKFDSFEDQEEKKFDSFEKQEKEKALKKLYKLILELAKKQKDKNVLSELQKIKL